VSWLPKWHGDHQVKGGLQFEHAPYGQEFSSLGRGDLVARYRNGVPDSVTVYNTPVTTSMQQYELAAFVQDSWTIVPRLTVNAGVRFENEKVPSYVEGLDGIEFDFTDKFAPRLGVAYDPGGDGKTRVYGSWGRYYDIFKLELPRGSFGGDKWIEYYYTLDTYDWPNLINSTACPPACPGTQIRGPIDFRSVSLGSDSLDPNLKPMRQQEATAGLEHQLNDRLSASVRYVHKQLDRAVEDTGFLLPDGSEGYVIANPGEGLTALAYTNPAVALPKPKRDYNSVEFAVEKRFADNWYLRSSYLWSRLYGNYTGLSQSDENGRTAPNVGRGYDYPMMMFQDGGAPAYGPLPTDRPHQFKTQFIYQLPVGASIGVNQYVASGLPVSREIGIYPPNTLPVQYKGSSPMVVDLIAGRVVMAIEQGPAVLSQIKAGRLKALAVTARKRSPSLPDVPTVEEAGLAGYETVQCFGPVAPAGTPKPVIDRLFAEFTKALKNPVVIERLAGAGLEVAPSASPEAYGQFIRAEYARWPAIVKAAGDGAKIQ